MSTSIEWTDETWNPLAAFDIETGKRGWFCTKVSDGCTRCYAEPINVRLGNGHKYRVGELAKVRFALVNLDAPLGWRKPRRVFVNSMTDLFHEAVSDVLIDRVFAIMAIADRHSFQVLTKRPERMRAYFADPLRWAMIEGTAQQLWHEHSGEDPSTWLALHGPLPNVWLGTSVENQEAADERIPLLLQTPAAVRFLSCEPLLGPLDLWLWLQEDERQIDWVIAGGESGPGARECDLGWIEAIVADCDLAGVACFVKQLGANPVCRNDWHTEDWPGASAPLADDYEPHHQGEIAPLDLRNRKGGDPAEWPSSLRVREFPSLATPAAQ